MSEPAARGRPRHPTDAITRALARRRWLIPYLLSFPLAAFLVAAYVIPALMTASYGFLGTDQRGGIVPEFTLANFEKFFSDSWYLLTLGRSVRIAVFVTLPTVSLGYLVAYFLVFQRPRGIEVFLILVIAPVLIGNVVRAFGWRMLMGEKGVVNTALGAIGLIDQPLSFLYTEHGIVIADTSVLLPLVILILLGVLSRVDPTYLEAAKSLGANGWRTFWHGTLPLSLPGVGAASVICFTLSFGTFETAIFIGGQRVQMVAPLVYQQIGKTFNWPFGAAISLVILVVSIAGICLHDFFLRRRT